MNQEEQEISKLFLDGFIADLEEYPEHYQIMFDVPIEKIKADPEYYYTLPVDGAQMNIHRRTPGNTTPNTQKPKTPAQTMRKQPNTKDSTPTLF